MLKEIIKQWKIEDLPIKISNTTWSIGDSFVLKEYVDQTTLLRNIQMMKSIELLFTAYFLSVGNEKLAKDSADLLLFISKNEKKILL